MAEPSSVDSCDYVLIPHDEENDGLVFKSCRPLSSSKSSHSIADPGGSGSYGPCASFAFGMAAAALAGISNQSYLIISFSVSGRITWQSSLLCTLAYACTFIALLRVFQLSSFIFSTTEGTDDDQITSGVAGISCGLLMGTMISCNGLVADQLVRVLDVGSSDVLNVLTFMAIGYVGSVLLVIILFEVQNCKGGAVKHASCDAGYGTPVQSVEYVQIV